MDDCELLREYVAHRSETAFAALVERHLPLVYAVALRVVREPQTAEDVAQSVFIDLARRAYTVRKGQAVSGWLYRATQRDALNALRSEKRRHQRETTAMNLAEKSTRPEIVPEQLAPLLEQAMGQLGRIEQDAVVLRYFEGKSLRETGEILALSEDAARKRVDRALDKMRAYFARAGITASAALLVSALSAHAAVASVPAGLAAKVAGVSVAGTAGAGGLSHALMKLFFMNTATKMALAGIAVAGAAYLVGHQRGEVEYIARMNAATQAENTPRSVATVVAARSSTLGLLTREQAWAQIKAFLETPSPLGFQSQTFSKILSQTNPDDFLFLLEQMANLSPDDLRDQAMELLSNTIKGPDLVKGLALANLISNASLRNRATNRILSAMIMWDTNTAEAELAKLPPGQQTQAIYRTVFHNWAGDNQTSGSAAAAAFALPLGEERTQAMDGVVDGWTYHYPEAVLTWATGLPPADSAVLKEAIIATGNLNAPLAAPYVDALTDVSARNAAIQSVARAWAVPRGANNRDYQDPSAALDWLDQVATGSTYDTNVEYIFSQLDPATAATMMDKITEADVRSVVIASIATRWASKDTPAALAWLQTLPASDRATRDPLMQKLVPAVSGKAGP